MKKLLFIIVLFPLLTLGQTGTQNYIKSTKFQDSIASGVPPIIQVVYFDGLGRPIQQIDHKKSGTGTDIITYIDYDKFGRQPKEYLPIVGGQSIAFHTIDSTSVNQYYSNPTSPSIEAIAVPFSEKQYEASPLNRIIKQAAPGYSWAIGNGHEVKFDFQANDLEGDRVKVLKVSTSSPSGMGAYQPALIQAGDFYPTGALYKNIIKDENWSATQDFPKLNTREEFKNIKGQVLLKRSYNLVDNLEKAHDTYYVYDDFGNLTYVIPPLAAAIDGALTAVLDDLCYQYKYDYRNRLIEKKLPGKQWEFIVYNNQNKPVATGPSLSPWGANEWGWTITKYDIFGRVVYTGWKADTISSESRNALQESLGVVWYEEAMASNTIDDVQVSYSNNTTPTAIKLLTVNYYDNYSHSFAPASIPTSIEGVPVSTKVKGLKTGSWVRVLTTESEIRADVTHVFFDYKGRVVRTELRNYLGGYTVTDHKLNFTGGILQSAVTHKRDASTIADEVKTKDFFTFSDQGRLLTHTQQINELPIQLVAKNEYDELGQLSSKQIGGTDVTDFVGLQKVDYSYNCRGWLKSINNVENLQEEENDAAIPQDLFALQLNYDNPESNADDQVNSLYNGNISEITWRTSADNVKRRYGYKYDNLNRLRKAIYQKPENAIPVTEMYNEEMDYDLNGNIQWLKRNGDLDDPYATFALEIDNLSYVYDAQKKNLLTVVTDASMHPKGFKDDPESIQNSNSNTGGSQSVGSNQNTLVDYIYDDNGNLLFDRNKGISDISYNFLNLPVEIKFDNSHKIEYLYDANGVKTQKKVTNGSLIVTTDYMNGFQYTNSLLSFFPHAEGYVNVTRCESCDEKFQNLYDYVFNYTDQLGNVRLSWALDKTTNLLKIVEENHYYPFGLKHTHYNVDHKHFEMQITNDGGPNTDGMPMTKMAQAITGNSGMLVDNKFKYNGKELQDELGLNLYDYGARNYDPELGRWINVDPLTEKYYSLSPYNYVGNMPVMAYDPNGKNLVLTGEAKNTTQMVKTLNDGLGNKYVKIDSKGNVTIKKLSTNEMGKLNAQQKALYGIIKNVVNIKETVSIEVVSSSDAVVIGDYDSERIDIADVNAFGEGKAVNQYSILGHEIAEQEIKQVLFDDYDLAHSDGVNAENSISGYKRGDEDSSKLIDVSRKEKYSGQLNIKFKGKKDVVTATIHLINNNVVKVERK